MSVICRKVGNSITVTIPKEITKEMGIRPGDEMDISINDKAIVFVPLRKKLKGESFLEDYYGKPIDEIGIIIKNNPEVDWGNPVGEEIW